MEYNEWIIKKPVVKGKFTKFPDIDYDNCASGIILNTDGSSCYIKTSEILKMYATFENCELKVYMETKNGSVYEIDRNVHFYTGCRFENYGNIDFGNISRIRS